MPLSTLRVSKSYVASLRRQACIVAAGKFGSNLCLFKNRDRNYLPKIKVVHEVRGGVEVAYLEDETTGWVEGLNAHGLGIVNAALMVSRDESERDVVERTGKKLPDGEQLLQALQEETVAAAAKSVRSYRGGLKGHTLISDGKKTVYIEMPDSNAVEYDEVPEGRVFVRTNHGVEFPDTGYVGDEREKSSKSRQHETEEVLSEVADPEDVGPALLRARKDRWEPTEMVRDHKSDRRMRTTTQMVLDLTEKRLLLYLFPGRVDFLGVEDRLPDGFKPEITIEVLEYEDLKEGTAGETKAVSKKASESLQVFVPSQGKVDLSKLPRGKLRSTTQGLGPPWGAFFTSTLVGKSTAWLDWCRRESFAWEGEEAVVFRVKPGAKVLIVSSEQEAQEVQARYPGSGPVSLIEPTIDWDAVMAAGWDGVRITKRFGRGPFYGWDAESTAWFNMEVLEVVAVVPRDHEGCRVASSLRVASGQGLLPILDPAFNIREVFKQLVLLEDHLAQPRKRCTDCIWKHMLTAEALAEEGVTLDVEKKHGATLGGLAESIRDLQRKVQDGVPMGDIASEARLLRKTLLGTASSVRVASKHLMGAQVSGPDGMQVIDNAGYKDLTGVRRIPVARSSDGQVVVGNEAIDEAGARIPGKPYMTDTVMAKLFDGSPLVIEEKVDGHPSIILYGGYTFFCEGLRVQHSVDYDKVPYSQEGWPDMVVVYDVLDGELEPPYSQGQGTGKWLSRSEKESLCETVGAPLVPLVWEGHVEPEDLPKLADRISSFSGGSKSEGIVLKNYRTGVFGKFINLEFQARLSDESLHPGGVHPMQRGVRNIRKWAARPIKVAGEGSSVPEGWRDPWGYFQPGDLIYYGKFQNKPGQIQSLFFDERGIPMVEVGAVGHPRRKNRVMSLYRLRHVDLPKRVASTWLSRTAGTWGCEPWSGDQPHDWESEVIETLDKDPAYEDLRERFAEIKAGHPRGHHQLYSGWEWVGTVYLVSEALNGVPVDIVQDALSFLELMPEDPGYEEFRASWKVPKDFVEALRLYREDLAQKIESVNDGLVYLFTMDVPRLRTKDRAKTETPR